MTAHSRLTAILCVRTILNLLWQIVFKLMCVYIHLYIHSRLTVLSNIYVIHLYHLHIARWLSPTAIDSVQISTYVFWGPADTVGDTVHSSKAHGIRAPAFRDTTP